MLISYDHWLVVLSIIIAVFTSYVALNLATRVAAAKGRRAAQYWLAGGALSMGTGIWSEHFIGMLAVQLPVPIAGCHCHIGTRTEDRQRRRRELAATAACRNHHGGQHRRDALYRRGRDEAAARRHA
jgi:hypothetical protein